MDNETRWRRYLSALHTYAEREGHAHVPTTHTEPGPDGPVALGTWISYIRQRHPAGRLDADRIADLDAVPGWTWGPLRPGPMTDHARNADIIALRHDKMSLQKIGDLYGLSRQRVHQIVHGQ
jgi:hypothetical protein